MSVSSSNQASNVSAYNVNPRKMRSACDGCHASKVRCTGEMTGCQRCRRSDKFCRYSESNMGRTLDGTQRRRKSSAPKSSLSMTATASHGDVDEFDWTPSSSMSTSTTLTDPFSSATENSELDQFAAESMALWDESRSLRHHDLGLLDQSRESSSGSGSLIRDLDDMDYEDTQSTLLDHGSPLYINLPQVFHSPGPRPLAQQQRQIRPSSGTSPTPSPSRLPNAASSPSPIQTWTTILEQLSHPQSPSPIPLDTVLHTTSTLLPRATHTLRSLAPDLSCLTPLVLILLCLTQAVAFFEQCLPAVVRGNAAGSGSRDLTVRLGAFQVDGEVQAVLQRHIVGKELARMLHVVRMVKQVLKNPGLEGVEKRVHEVVVEDLVERIKVLGRLLAEKGGVNNLVSSDYR